MRRREFIALFGGAAATWPLVAQAQQPAMPLVGFLADGTPEGYAPRLAAFKRGLADGGYSEGRNVAVEPRFASHNYDLLPSLAEDLARRQVSAIATVGSEKVTRAAKAATATIPIVAVLAGDPVKRGLVASINHPGGNLTVVSLFTSSDNALVAKRLEMLHEVVPKAATVGWLVDANILDYDTQLQEMQNAARALGLKLVVARVAKDSELEAAFASLVDQGAGAMNRACSGWSPRTRSRSGASCCSAVARRTCSAAAAFLMAGVAVFTGRLALLRTGDVGGRSDRDAGGAGARRRDRAPGGAVDRDEHVPRGRRAEQGTGRVGRHRGERRGRRGARRRPAHPLRRLAVHLLPQRPDRRGGVAARPAHGAGEPTRPRHAGATTRSARSR